MFCFRVCFKCSCQRSSSTDHCWWSFPICTIIIGTICSTEVSLHLLFSYPHTKMSSLHSHKFFTLLHKREIEQKAKLGPRENQASCKCQPEKKGQDLQVLKTAILQFFVSTFNKNVDSYLICLCKDSVSEGKLFTMKMKKLHCVLLLNCPLKNQNIIQILIIVIHVIYITHFSLYFTSLRIQLKELKWNDQTLHWNTMFLPPLSLLHISQPENLFSFLSFLQATNHGHVNTFPPSSPSKWQWQKA